MSIRTRITLFGLAVLVGVLGCFSAGIFALVSGGLPQGQDKQLTTRGDEAARSLATAPAAALTPVPALAPVDPRTSDDVFVIVLDDAGTVLSHTGAADAALPAGMLAAADAQGSALATVSLDGVAVRVYVRPWHRADLGRGGYVAAAQAVRRQQSDRRGIFVLLVVSSLLTVLAAALAIPLVVHRALRPLRELTATADEIGRSASVDRRLPGRTRLDDLGRLTVSFNAMLDRLADARRYSADALAAQQRFTADASHELRTPLTTIRANAGFLRANPDAAPGDRDAALADIESESERMTRLVGDLLTLARADGGQRPEMAPVDLGELAHTVCRQARVAHPDRSLHCAGAPVVIVADADGLTQLLWILIDNAVQHTAEGGTIWVAVTRHGATVTLWVADDGVGIPPEALGRVFDRFYRADAARRHGGTGLGLAIAASIARAHGGAISASGNARGGAIFAIELIDAGVPARA